MYAEFFGLTQDPFSIAPDPRYLFMSERHREALAHLLYGIRGGGGFVLLSGEIGAGKTTICRCFLEQIPERCRVAYIFNPKLTVGDLLKTICREFHVEVKHEGIGPATIKDYLDPYQVNIADPQGSLGINLGVYGAPETFLIDARGVIRYKHVGVLTPAVIAGAPTMATMSCGIALFMAPSATL